MRDVQRLSAMLTIAMLAGAGCGSESSDKDGISVDLSKIGGGRSAKPKPEDETDTSAGEYVIEPEPDTALPPEPPKIDPQDHCGSSGLILGVAEAKTKAVSVSTAHDCPYTINDVGDELELKVYETGLLRDAGETEHCCYSDPVPIPPPPPPGGGGIRRGRPLVVGGHEQLPTFDVGARHAPPIAPTRAVAGWLHDARIELASVGSFRRAAAELARAGAPASLVDACHQAAVDEQRHAAQCLAVARRLGGRDLRLGPVPEADPRDGSRLELLQHTFTEGCVAETTATVVALRSANRAGDPAIRATLERIADDEARHAALAWATIGWGMTRLTASERARFVAWAHAQRPPVAGDRGDDTLAAWGRIDARSEAAIAREVWTGCIAPMLAARPEAPRAAAGSIAFASA